MMWYAIIKYFGLFVLAGFLGISMLRVEMWQSNNRHQQHKEGLKKLDWIAYFYKSGCFGLVFAFFGNHFFFKQQMSIEMYVVFVVTGAFLGERIVPFFLSTVFDVVKKNAEMYNKDIEAKWNKEMQKTINNLKNEFDKQFNNELNSNKNQDSVDSEGKQKNA